MPWPPTKHTFPFHHNHPLEATHSQLLRSKHLLPILVGKPPPEQPSPRQNTPQWMRSAEHFGAYYVTLLAPWATEAQFLPPVEPTFAGLCQWAAEASSSSTIGREWLKRCRYDLFAIIATGLSVNAREKTICGAWRAWNSDEWSQKSNASSTHSCNLEVDEQNRGGCACLDR